MLYICQIIMLFTSVEIGQAMLYICQIIVFIEIIIVHNQSQSVEIGLRLGYVVHMPDHSLY